MNPIILPLAMKKENSKLKPVKLRLKIDLVSYPARAEGLGKYGCLKLFNYVQIKLLAIFEII